MNIQIAQKEDLDLLCLHDKHITKEELKYSIFRHRVYIAKEAEKFIGWLRYNLFWDNTPFLNMLYFLENYRRKGYGGQLISFWEEQMRSLHYECVMTSTASDEYAQHFYIKSGYRAIGGFNYQAEPYEIILMKEI